MDDYKGFYFKNQKEQKYFEGGAHFKYKDLYNKLIDLYNKINNINFPQQYCNLNWSPQKNKNLEKNENNSIKIKKEKYSSNSKKKTRNNKNNTKLSQILNDSDSKDNNRYKEVNLNILDKSKDNNNFYNDLNKLKYETCRLSYYNKMFHKIHHNSINKNYQFTNRKNKKNLSAAIKIEENQMNKNTNNNQVNKSINNQNVKNKSNKNHLKTIYNYSYLKYKNNNTKKMPKLKTNNEKNKYIFDMGKYSYNLYDNIYLKNKIQNNLKQFKYNSLVKENNCKNHSIKNISKSKDKSNNNSIRSIDKNYNNQKINNTKRLQCHIDSIDYVSIYQGINNIKTPTYKIKNGIFKNKSSKISNEPIYNIKAIINNKKNYEDLLNQVNKNKTSYAKIKKNKLSFTKTKKLNNKEIAVKERIKRDTQSTEYE